jgi:serine/threonine-protein kinase
MTERDLEAPPPSVPLGTVVAGRYRVERQLGVGGMGEVYLVQHVHTDEKFAMKVLLSTVISDESALERFRREARTPARIDSEHVVRVTDADVAPELKGAPFLVMEYLRGEDLDAFLERTGPMQPRDVVSYLRQLARALDKAHALGIVHRDLKPENIFITQREDGTPHVKVLDFGIAKFTSQATGDLIHKTATSPGQIYGTPLYMSPEQAKGESRKISPQTDIWALGLIANRMLSGKDYWDAETLTALIAQVVYEPMQKPCEKGFDFGPQYDAWFLQCCNRDPEARFSTAGEAVFRLGQATGVIDADATFLAGAPSIVNEGLPSVPAISMRGAVSPKPFSRTELQLAQTGVAETPGKQDRGTFLKVAVGALVVGAAVAGLFFGMGGTAGTPRTAAVPTTEPRQLPPAGANADRPTTEVVAQPANTAAGSAEPTSTSAEPAASASAVPPTASAEPAKTPKPPAIGGKPAVSGKPPKDPPKPPPKDPPKDPPKAGNPLDTRT